jgi:hypothetical protein
LTTALLDGIRYDRLPAQAEEADQLASTARLAATLVARQVIRHPCRRNCLHRNHRRDRHYQELILEALGLEDGQARPSDYETRLAWHAVTRSDIVAMSSGR